MVWISRVLPLTTFSDICRKVYFAVDDYNDIVFILANGYLSYVFSEYASESSLYDYREYCRICRENLHAACARLPLLLPPSMEVIAALTLGVRNFLVSKGYHHKAPTNVLCRRLTASKIRRSHQLGALFRMRRISVKH